MYLEARPTEYMSTPADAGGDGKLEANRAASGIGEMPRESGIKWERWEGGSEGGEVTRGRGRAPVVRLGVAGKVHLADDVPLDHLVGDGEVDAVVPVVHDKTAGGVPSQSSLLRKEHLSKRRGKDKRGRSRRRRRTGSWPA